MEDGLFAELVDGHAEHEAAELFIRFLQVLLVVPEREQGHFLRHSAHRQKCFQEPRHRLVQVDAVVDCGIVTFKPSAPHAEQIARGGSHFFCQKLSYVSPVAKCPQRHVQVWEQGGNLVTPDIVVIEDSEPTLR